MDIQSRHVAEISMCSNNMKYKHITTSKDNSLKCYNYYENFGIPSRWIFFYEFLSMGNCVVGMYPSCHISHTYVFCGCRSVEKDCMLVTKVGTQDGFFVRQKQALFGWNFWKITRPRNLHMRADAAKNPCPRPPPLALHNKIPCNRDIKRIETVLRRIGLGNRDQTPPLTLMDGPSSNASLGTLFSTVASA